MNPLIDWGERKKKLCYEGRETKLLIEYEGDLAQ